MALTKKLPSLFYTVHLELRVNATLSWPSAATPSNVLDNYMFNFWLHSWKSQHDPLHHNKNTSQQNMHCPSKLERLSFQTWRCQQTDTITACHCTPNHCTLVSTTTPGTWAMKRDPWAGMQYHGSLSNRIFPHVSCSRNHGKPHMLGCSCCLTPWVCNYEQSRCTDFKLHIWLT